MEVAAPARADFAVDRLDRATAVMSAASAEALRQVAECDHRKLWRRDGATSMTSWLAARYHLAWGTAREWVRVAHALGELPRIAEAYAAGRLSWDQVQPLTRFATPETDRMWAQKAGHIRPSTLWREARRHQRIRVRDAEAIRGQRYLWLSWDRDRPVLWLEGMLPAEEGAALESALARRAEALPRDPDAVDSSGARLVDALVDVTTGGPRPATLVVHAGADVLVREETDHGPWVAETEGRASSGLRDHPPSGLRRADRVGPGVSGPPGGDRAPGPSGSGPDPPGPPAPGRRLVSLPRMRPEAMAPRPPPGSLGRRRRHEPRQPRPPVPHPPPADP
jgi:hypothetical protein